MTRLISILILVFLISCRAVQADSGLSDHPYYVPKTDVSIAEAVAQFNQRANADQIGKTQPALTSDEVIAAIRGWIPKEHPHSEIFFNRFEKIAQTGIIPAGCYLDFIHGWKNYKGCDFTVWWIDLMVVPEKSGDRVEGLLGYNYRLRAQMISSRPHQETPASVQAQK